MMSVTRPVTITDHALLRWLERVHGIDVEFMRSKLRERVYNAAAAGMSAWQTPEANYYFKNGSLTTVLPPGKRASRRSRFS